ncbi:MAG TPA: alpha/beta hydrolase, partial [Arenibaculum sp.]|nr:alpha/beta hydrolase [Arenibaculum sp.]
SIGRLIARLVRLPLTLARGTTEILTANADALRFDPQHVRFGSLYGMTPGSPLITSLAEIPVAPGVAAHSIVAVQGDGPPEDGTDGVVRYRSAHIDGVDSELIVRSGHSSQASPYTIAEVRRILLLHAAQTCLQDGIGCID